MELETAVDPEGLARAVEEEEEEEEEEPKTRTTAGERTEREKEEESIREIEIKERNVKIIMKERKKLFLTVREREGK